ncbi:MAG: hypothetical protein K8R35_11475 [Bacteroidales bacterium]|nr:hypothetical protein [Bacteroidales bacterium]
MVQRIASPSGGRRMVRNDTLFIKRTNTICTCTIWVLLFNVIVKHEIPPPGIPGFGMTDQEDSIERT